MARYLVVEYSTADGQSRAHDTLAETPQAAVHAALGYEVRITRSVVLDTLLLCERLAHEVFYIPPHPHGVYEMKVIVCDLGKEV